MFQLAIVVDPGVSTGFRWVMFCLAATFSVPGSRVWQLVVNDEIDITLSVKREASFAVFDIRIKEDLVKSCT